MAGIPCVSDTCSITSTVDGSGRLQLNARLDPTGGITCTEGVGLGVTFPASAKAVVLSTAMDDRASIAAGATVDHSAVIANLSSVPMLVVVDAKFDYKFTYLAAAAVDSIDIPTGTLNADDYISARYYSFDIGYDVQVGGGSVLSGGSFAESLHGIGPSNGSGSDQRAASRKTSAVFTIAAGSSQTFVLRATRSALGSGTNGTISSTGPTNGILMSARLAFVELPASTSATVV